MSRLPVLKPEDMNDEQKAVREKIISGPRGRSAAIFNLLVNSASFCDTAQEVGAYLRYKSKVSDRVRELAICISSTFSKADFEWRAHMPLAVQAGVPESTLNSIGRGVRPDFSTDEDRLVYEYISAVLAKKGIPDAIFEEAREKFGDEQLMDLTGLAGYYTMLATVMLAHGLMPEPEEPRAPWRD